jgi:uncharacterized SAM-binding protein YcdF (DUF218 family)
MGKLGFIAKKVISAFCYPLGFSLLLLIAGLLLLWFRRRSRIGWVLLVAGTAVLFIASSPLTGFLLLKSVENRAGSYCDPAELADAGVRYVLVLGGGARDESLTPADRVGGDIFRVMEGVRLWRGIPGAKLALSGMGFPSTASKPSLMTALPEELGVPADALIVKAEAWDTADESRCFAELVGKRPFALVTSAYHMARARNEFEKQGLKPIPCPCEFRKRRPPSISGWFVPGAGALLDTQIAIHELLGGVWSALRR